MPNYDFKTLSDYDFEALTRDLLQKELEITLESFKPGKDQGIDLRYAQDSTGTLVVQCKHYANSSFTDLYSTLRNSELHKVRRLSPQRYILVTSLGLSPADKDRIKELFEPYCQKTGDIYGKDDINNLLGKFPQIEKNNFKLWMTSTQVLELIVNADVYQKSFVEKQLILQKVQLYVRNQSYEKAKELLESKHYCIIAGIPGIGKTTLAEILCFEYMSNEYEFIRVSGNIDEAYQVFNQTKKQIFYYDDFLGQTNLKEKLGKNEEQSLLSFFRVARKFENTRFILTTREYILYDALLTYEKLASAEDELYKCVIDLRDYTQQHRAHILYNHLYFSNLSVAFIEQIINNKRYWQLIRHRNYNPRIIDRMTDPMFLSGIIPEQYVDEFVKNLDDPKRIWEHIFENQLSQASKNLLLVLFSLPSVITLETLGHAFWSFHKQSAEINNSPTSPEDFKNALKSLEGNFIISSKISGEIIVRFHNPSVRDFLENYLIRDPSPVKRLIQCSIYFEQCQRFWKSKPELRSYTRDLVEIYANQLFKVFDSKECGIIDYGTHIVRMSNSSIERLTLISEVLDSLENEEMHNKLGQLLETILYDVYQYDKDELIDLAEQLNETFFDFGIDMDNIIDKIEDHILEDLNQIEDYETALSFIQRVRRYTHSKTRLGKEFEEFLSKDVSKKIGSDESASSLRNYRDTAESIGSELNVDVSAYVSDIESRLNELEIETEEIFPQKTTPNFKDNSVLHDESEINSLFDSLISELRRPADVMTGKDLPKDGQ